MGTSFFMAVVLDYIEMTYRFFSATQGILTWRISTLDDDYKPNKAGEAYIHQPLPATVEI